jgi:hypothetical protein
MQLAPILDSVILKITNKCFRYHKDYLQNLVDWHWILIHFPPATVVPVAPGAHF